VTAGCQAATPKDTDSWPPNMDAKPRSLILHSSRSAFWPVSGAPSGLTSKDGASWEGDLELTYTRIE